MRLMNEFQLIECFIIDDGELRFLELLPKFDS